MSSIELSKIIGLEEHFVTAPVLAAWEALEPRWQDLSLMASRDGTIGHRLADLGSTRRAAMADLGVDMQVLSLSAPGVQNLAPEQAVVLQTETNDALAQWVQDSPEHFQGFATLATPAPERAAEELRRAVTTLGLDGAMLFGRTRDRNLDHLDNWAIFEAAEELNAPLYLHPQSPPPAVRAAYYDGFDPTTNAAFATYGSGWHYEAGVQLLRMMVAGVFDRFPELRVITGHWGEMLLFYLDRIDQLTSVAKRSRKPSEYFRTNVFVTPSGIQSQRYLRWTIEILGADRILFASDYPFVPLPSGGARSFLADSDLADADRNLVASGNWERLRAQIRR